MSLEFPFEYAQVDRLGVLFYPIVQAELKTVIGWKKFSFLVDTGADITTVPSHLLPVLGIKKSKLPHNKTFGVGGISVNTWDFKLSLKFADTELTISACAVETKNDVMPLLLGRKDIFEDKFNVCLDSQKKVTIITQNK